MVGIVTDVRNWLQLVTSTPSHTYTDAIIPHLLLWGKQTLAITITIIIMLCHHIASQLINWFFFYDVHHFAHYYLYMRVIYWQPWSALRAHIDCLLQLSSSFAIAAMAMLQLRTCTYTHVHIYHPIINGYEATLTQYLSTKHEIDQQLTGLGCCNK